jgi:hypothetical protein
MKNSDEGFEGTFQLIGICDEIKQCEMLVVALMESNLYELNMNVMIRAKMTSLAYFNTNFYNFVISICTLYNFGTKGWCISMQRM